ncbi:MAG TPA: DNA-formamidopyrimidine glycosylase [Desulfuromonadales bacterium]|nr:DNA-formamidopyrimidine glycosylase [Desulfuromonadales bacterium]
MPELPEVESVLRCLRDEKTSLIGRAILTATALSDTVVSDISGAEFAANVAGYRFSEVSRHGKYLIFTLVSSTGNNEKRYLAVHLRMTGRLYLVNQDEAIQRHTRLVLLLDAGVALRFDDPRKFGRVWLVTAPDQVTGTLGPDALTMSIQVFAERFSRHRRQLKPLLLDQSFVAGIGNIYADEILFRAGIHPLTHSNSLSEQDINRLHGKVIEVLIEAVAVGGANIDGVFKEGGFVVQVYGRADLPCLVCGSIIEKIRVGQRGTHYCPECQPSEVHT